MLVVAAAVVEVNNYYGTSNTKGGCPQGIVSREQRAETRMRVRTTCTNSCYVALCRARHTKFETSSGEHTRVRVQI